MNAEIIAFSAVNLDDLHMFDPVAMAWTQISRSDMLGVWPSARKYTGIASIHGILYVFGGLDDSGE
jgi:hypothetical protein